MRKGIFYLVLAAILCSTGGVCIKSVPWSPMAINGARNAIAVCVTLCYLRSTHRHLRWNSAVLCGAFSLALTTNLHVLSTKLTSSACAILLMYTAPLWVTLYLWLFKKQRPHAKQCVTCAMMFFGLCIFVADNFATGTVLGLACGIGSGIAYAGVFLVGTWRDGDAQSSYFYGQLMGAVLGMPFLLQLSAQAFTVQAVSCILVLGVFQLGISYVLMAKGVTLTPPVTASLITALEPILTPVWVALFLGEVPSALACVGAGFVLASVVWQGVQADTTD